MAKWSRLVMMANSIISRPPVCVTNDAKVPPTLPCSTELREQEVGKCPCGRLYGLSADEERIHFHRAEIPVRQHPYELPGLELCPRAVFARRGDPQPGDGACRGSFVDGDGELAINAHGDDAAVLAEGESRRGVRRTDDHGVAREVRRHRRRAALP